jgi:hypothetical protein
MPSSHAISTTNLIKTATVTPSTSAIGNPAANLSTPERPYLTWRSTNISATNIVIDLGSAKNVDKVVLLNANFALCTIESNTSNSWGAPAYTSPPIAVRLDPDGIFYRRVWERAVGTPLTLRWIRLVIPAQTPIGGAGYFQLGGIHLGTWTTLPLSPRPGYGRAVPMPEIYHAAVGDGPGMAVQTGSAFARQRWTRHAGKDAINPGVGDEFADWIAIDRQIRAAGRLFCHAVGHWGDAAVWMMRQRNQSDWQDLGLVHTEDDWLLDEATAG